MMQRYEKYDYFNNFIEFILYICTMGYRNYIGTLSKTEHEKIKNFSKDQMYKYKDEEDHLGVYNIVDKSLYGLGKYVDVFEKSLFSPVFENKETQDYFTEEHDFYIVDKEFVLAVIDRYSEEIRKHYISMLGPFFVKKNKRSLPGDFLNSAEINYDDEKDDFQYKFDFNLITEDQQTALFNMIKHIENMGNQWGVNSFFNDFRPYDLREHTDSIASGSKYEYQIFELVRIYKSFDWENNYMIYYGY